MNHNERYTYKIVESIIFCLTALCLSYQPANAARSVCLLAQKIWDDPVFTLKTKHRLLKSINIEQSVAKITITFEHCSSYASFMNTTRWACGLILPLSRITCRLLHFPSSIPPRPGMCVRGFSIEKGSMNLHCFLSPSLTHRPARLPILIHHIYSIMLVFVPRHQWDMLSPCYIPNKPCGFVLSP